MGMFDEVRFECNNCGEYILVQSKADECSLITYDKDSVPLSIAADIEGEYVRCDHCGRSHVVEFAPVTKATVKMRLTV